MSEIEKTLFACCVIFVVCLILQVEGEACPPTIGPFRRVGKTQFYIAHEPTRGKFVNYEEARALCEANGLPMAKIPDMQTNAVLGRALEEVVEAEKLKDTWYWLDAVFDDATERYKWGKDGSEGDVEYGAFLYRKHRPTGVGSYVNYKGEYVIHKDVKQCLTFSMPWPGKGDPNRKGIAFGHQTILDERPCISKKTRHAMCRSNRTDCEVGPRDPFVLSIGQSTNDYFEMGNWIIGDRKYIVNWKHRTQEYTEAHCKEFGLEMVDPGVVSSALVPYLKMWSRNITISQFWTALKFEAKTKTFTSSNGEDIGQNILKVEYKDREHVISARSNKHDTEFCVALSLSYEFQSQMACEDPTSSACSWSFIDYIPANCNNYLAAICQHKDQNERQPLKWDARYFTDTNGISKALNDNAVTMEFGFPDNTEIVRSKYKQTFGSLVCPDGYRMMRKRSDQVWSKKPDLPAEAIYRYDYKETYWVVDDQGFKINSDSECTLSHPDPFDGDGYKRAFRKVACTEWHFYLCEKVKGAVRMKPWNVPPIPPMEWSGKRQARIYPILQ